MKSTQPVPGPLQIGLGDLHGVNSYEHQPAEVAAVEGDFETQRGAPLVLFGWPDAKAEATRYEIAIRKLASLYLTHTIDGEVKGLKAFPRNTWPTSLPLVFFAFRTMVGLGVLIAALGITALVLRSRKRLYDARWFQRWAVAMGPAGFLAVTAGWVTTEAGRQPFTVYGLLRTADSVGPVAAPAVAASLLAFVIVYTVVFGPVSLSSFTFSARHPARTIQGRRPTSRCGRRGSRRRPDCPTPPICSAGA